MTKLKITIPNTDPLCDPDWINKLIYFGESGYEIEGKQSWPIPEDFAEIYSGYTAMLVGEHTIGWGRIKGSFITNLAFIQKDPGKDFQFGFHTAIILGILACPAVSK